MSRAAGLSDVVHGATASHPGPGSLRQAPLTPDVGPARAWAQMKCPSVPLAVLFQEGALYLVVCVERWAWGPESPSCTLGAVWDTLQTPPKCLQRGFPGGTEPGVSHSTADTCCVKTKAEAPSWLGCGEKAEPQADDAGSGPSPLPADPSA